MSRGRRPSPHSLPQVRAGGALLRTGRVGGGRRLKPVAASVPADPDKLAESDEVGRKGPPGAGPGRKRPPPTPGRGGGRGAGGVALVRALLGLDQVVSAISGAAPIAVEVFDFFRARRADLGDLRDERVVGADDVGSVPDQGGHRRPGDPGQRGAARRGRRGDLPGRQRLPRLPQRSGEDRRGARRRRLAALRRHRRVRRRRLPAHRRPQEGADHHRGRQERLAGEPRGRAQGPGAHRPGVRDRRGPAVHLGARGVSTPRSHRRGRRSTASAPRACSSWPTTRRSWPR